MSEPEQISVLRQKLAAAAQFEALLTDDEVCAVEQLHRRRANEHEGSTQRIARWELVALWSLITKLTDRLTIADAKLGRVVKIIGQHEIEPSIYDGDDRSIGSAEGAYDLANDIREALK